MEKDAGSTVKPAIKQSHSPQKRSIEEKKVPYSYRHPISRTGARSSRSDGRNAITPKINKSIAFYDEEKIKSKLKKELEEDMEYKMK